jgi:SAM-dependent methyltransferase
MWAPGLKRRAKRALERQLDYQRKKARALKGYEAEIMASMARQSARVREKLKAAGPIAKDARIIEVGSGAHGLIFFFEGAEKIGIDPLADHYRELFPAWQDRARTLAASGQSLPFRDASFDVALCDNVVDHADDPRGIVRELSRVLRPGGLLYFTVNVHHPIYHWAANAHAAWRALGVPFEITPFADHTVHLTIGGARRLFAGLPLTIVRQSDDIEETKREGRRMSARHAGDRLKRWFFKNARWEVIAVREG